MQLDESVQRLLALDEEISQAEKGLKSLKKKRDDVAYELRQFMHDSGLEGMRVGGYNFSIKITNHAQIKDWEVLSKWILSTGRLDILPKRLAKQTLLDLEEEGKAPEGAYEWYPEESLSMLKSRKGDQDAK